MTKFILVRQVGQTLVNVNGCVRSLTGDGGYTWVDRDPGTAGAWETCVVSGNIVVYNPTGAQPVAFQFLPSVPNAPGWCGLVEVAL